MEEPLVAALPIGHPLLDQPGPLPLDELVLHPLIVYPSKPRPSYADQVLSILRERRLKASRVREVRELQTALGLVAADVGISLVPAAIQRLRRDDIVYRRLQDATVTSPIILCSASTITPVSSRPFCSLSGICTERGTQDPRGRTWVRRQHGTGSRMRAHLRQSWRPTLGASR